jgi:hypothetical protein
MLVAQGRSLKSFTGLAARSVTTTTLVKNVHARSLYGATN